jgi:DNA end-binding protein Ku
VRTSGDKYIMLETMFWSDEVRSGEELQVPAEVELGAREKTMARTLIETLSAGFEPQKYRNRQREAVAELIQKKIQGKQVLRQPEAAIEVIDLMEALKKSVEKAKSEKKPPRRRKAAGENQLEAGPAPPTGG